MLASTANHLPQRHCMYRNLSLLIFLFMSGVVAMDYEKQAYFELVPYEITSLIIKKIPAPDATLPQAARSVLDAALLDKEFLALAQPVMQKYKAQHQLVNWFVKEHTFFSHILFALPRAVTVHNDVHSLRTISSMLCKQRVSYPKIFAQFQSAHKADHESLKLLLSTHPDEANKLLREKCMLLYDYSDKKDSTKDNNMQDIRILLECGANPNS